MLTSETITVDDLRRLRDEADANCEQLIDIPDGGDEDHSYAHWNALRLAAMVALGETPKWGTWHRVTSIARCVRFLNDRAARKGN